MGTKFANFHIRNIHPAIVQGLMPHCIVRELSKGWTTIMHEDFQIGQIEREARKLSKRINHSILSVGYYDGDILVVGVFNLGKSVALHVSNNGYGYEAKMGNPGSFQRFLELNEADAPLLKEIFKCEDIEKKINLLEHLLEVPIWIHYDSFSNSNEESGQLEFNKSIIHDYINETKAASKR